MPCPMERRLCGLQGLLTGSFREWTTRHPFVGHRLPQGKPNSNALIQRNAVLMRVAKSKLEGRLREVGLISASWD